MFGQMSLSSAGNGARPGLLGECRAGMGRGSNYLPTRPSVGKRWKLTPLSTV
jgi:hypothetical protein